MTIQLTQARVVNGVVTASGTIVSTLSAAEEADFITNGWATRVGARPYISATHEVFAASGPNGEVNFLAGAKTLKATEITNAVLLVGDSMTHRHFHYHIASGAGSLVGTPNTDVSWPITAGTADSGQAVTGSRCRITSATSAALNTWATVVSQNGTTMTVRYGFDVTGLTPGTATIWLEALQGDTGYFHHVRALHRLQGINSSIIENQGIAGNRFDDVYSRYATDIAPYLPCRVALLCGFNDAISLVAGTTGYTQPEILAHARTLIDQLLTDGATIDLISPIPFVTGASGVSTNEAAAIALLKAIRAQHQGYANKYPTRIKFVDAWTAVEDPSGGGTGYALAGMLTTSDSIHPCIVGAEAIAAQYVTDTAGTWIEGGVFTSLSNDDDYVNGGLNCIANPMLNYNATPPTGYVAGTHSGGTWTAGTVPDSCVMTLNGGTMNSADHVQRPQGGYDYSLNWTTTGATAMEFTQDITNNGVKGTSRRCSVEIETAGDISNTQYLNAAIEIVDGGITQHILCERHLFSTAQGQRWPAVGTRYRFESDAFPIPATATSVKFRVQMNAGAAGTHQVKIGSPQVW